MRVVFALFGFNDFYTIFISPRPSEIYINTEQESNSHDYFVFLLLKMMIIIDVSACHVLFVLRSPPADHWVLVSGLPTYVAETGLVSVCFSLELLWSSSFISSLL